MQSEVIDDILNIEAEAEKIVSDAEQKAQEIILDAEATARKKIQARVESARKEGTEQLESANKLLEQHIAEYEKERVRIEQEGTKVDPNVLSSMIKRAVDRISSIE